MGRILLASIIGALVVFVWGYVAWARLDLYKAAFHPLPSDAAVVASLAPLRLGTAAYMFPAMPAKDDAAAMDAWAARHKSGPIGMVLYRAEGADPMHWSVLLRGYIIELIACFLMACMMVAAHLRTWGMRFTLAVIMAAFAVMVTYGVTWNFLFIPDSYAMALATDVMVGWLVAGAVVAAILKPAAAAA